MDRNFAYILPKVLVYEGGYVNNKADPGGPTNYGITLATMRQYLKSDATAADVKKLTKDQASAIYYKRYWAPILGPDLPSGVDMAVFDYAVNSGPKTAAQCIQRILGVAADGKLGPMTMKAAKKADPEWLIDAICDQRLGFMKRLKGGKLWKTFGKGWQRRVDSVRYDAKAIIGKSFDTTKTISKPVALVADPSLEKPWYQSISASTVLGGGGVGGISLASLATDVLPSIDWKMLAIILSFAMIGVAGVYFINRKTKQANVAKRVAEIENQEPEVVEEDS